MTSAEARSITRDCDTTISRGVWRKLSSRELVLSLGLKQVLGKRGLQEIGGVWGAVEQELGGREEGSLRRQEEAGR